LEKIFKKFGKVTSCRILKDNITQTSRGVGFVNFERHEDATNAIRALNGTKIDAPTNNRPQPLQVKFANVRPAAEETAPPTTTSSDVYGPTKSKVTTTARYHPFAQNTVVESEEGTTAGTTNNLYCCGFPKGWSKQQLEELFRQTSTQILSSRILLDPQTNQSRGIGFIRFGSYEEALKAIAELNGKTVEGSNQPLQVRFAKERNKPATDPTTAIPTGLTYDPTTQQYVYYSYGTQAGYDPSSVFGATPPEGYQFAIAGTDGSLSTATYPYYYSGGTTSSLTTSGYPYYSADGGTSGLVPPPGYQFATIGPDGSLTPVPTPQPGPISLFVLHIPSNFRDDDLNQLFKDYGTVVTAKVMLDPSTGQSKGYGFVNMSTYMEAQAAIAGLNGYHVPNTNKYLKVSFKTAGPGAKKENPFD